MSFEILVIAFLLLLNGFFALSELAIVSASKPLLQQMANQGRLSARIAIKLKENPGRFLSTVQVGITLVGILAGAYGGAGIAQNLAAPLNDFSFINPHGETIAVILVVACITYFSVVVGELVPKQAALNNAEHLALLVARPMAWLSLICTPIVIVLEMSAVILIKILGINTDDKGVTENEIKAVIAEGVASGAIEESEHNLMRRIIRLGDRDVKSIMTHRTDVTFIDMKDTLEDVRRTIAMAGHSRYPVIEGDRTRVVGMIKTKQLMASHINDQNFAVKDFVDDIVYVSENMGCLDALSRFKKQTIHLAAVIDEYGTFEGIFTTSDILEAIVGIMPSNYDNNEAPHILRRADGSWLVDGLTPIDEIHMTLGLEAILADADYQTIAGFMLSKLETSPATGQTVTFSGHIFEIVDMDRHRIDKILVTPQSL